MNIRSSTRSATLALPTGALFAGNASDPIERISAGTGGVEANGNSYGPEISGNGHVIALRSTTRNLAAGDDNIFADIFVRNYRDSSSTSKATTQRLRAQKSRLIR